MVSATGWKMKKEILLIEVGGINRRFGSVESAAEFLGKTPLGVEQAIRDGNAIHRESTGRVYYVDYTE